MMKASNLIRAAALMLAMTGTTALQANAQGSIALKTVAEKEVQVLNANGVKERRLVPAEKVVPGEEVIYTIFFTNVGGQPTDNVVITDPIPANTRYKDGSAFGPGTEISFSVDGARYDRPENLRVVGADGRERPPPRRTTAIFAGCLNLL